MKTKSTTPTVQREQALWNRGFIVVGVDEVGRGALSGPVYIGFVVLRPVKKSFHYTQLGINDSKKLTAKQRENLVVKIKKISSISGIAYSTVYEINRLGIVKAVAKAVRKGLKEVSSYFTDNGNIYLLIDGFPIRHIRRVGPNQEAIIKGDCLCLSIAAASILAKVERDRSMSDLAATYPHYQWDRNKGYATRDHIQAIRTFGITRHHRKLFVRKALTHPRSGDQTVK